MTAFKHTLNAALLGMMMVAAVIPATGCGKKKTLQRPPVDPAPAATPEPATLRIDTDQRGAYLVDVPLPPPEVQPSPTPQPRP